MGCFTWTDARFDAKKKKNGDYYAQYIIGYGGFAKIVCPDDTEIKELSYDGYGIFDNKDIYDLVVDWNREHLDTIFEKIAADDPNAWGIEFRPLAIAYQRNDEAAINAELHKLIASGKHGNYIRDEWKRNIGIAIACGEKYNSILPYPIKITATKWHKKYSELKPSYYCQ